VKLTHVIRFVKNMDEAVAYYRDTLGLPLKFQSPEWSEFATGQTVLALHAGSENHPPGTAQLGWGVADIDAFYEAMKAKGVKFTLPPTRQDFGGTLAAFLDADGAECSVSAHH
jgi:catechol 2,3-dioxygenase-like lactoylglutathione lyase family enzyme